MPKVDAKHPQYVQNLERWELMRDILRGDVKDHCLPIVDTYGCKTNKQYKRCLDRNNKYAEIGRFLNFTLQTKNGLVGTALSKPGMIELPTDLEYLLTESTGNKLKLDQLITRYIGELLTMGRAGGFVDYPTTAQVLTEDERKAKNINPRMYFYDALSIFNWDSSDDNGYEKDTFIVLYEPKWERKDGFEWKMYKEYRVLELEPLENGDMIFKVSVIDETGKPVLLPNDAENPTYPKKNGQFWNDIPFYFFGATDNNADVDYAPLDPIAHINIGHYRNSCGYEDNLETHGQCTAVVRSDLPQAQWNELYKDRPIKMGSKEAYFVGANGGIDLVQCGPNQEAANAMRHKEEQMISLGAFVMLPTSANAPVETTRMHTTTKTSVLQQIVENTEDGVLQLIKWCGEYKGLTPQVLDSIVFSLNRDYIQEAADPNIARELAAQWVQGLLPRSIVTDYWRKSDIIPDSMDDDDLTDLIDEEPPIDLSTGDNVDEQQTETN